MPETDKVFAGSIPENYDRYLVPLIFESFAQDIAQRAGALSPRSVLETAAGSGVVTRALTPRLSPDASYAVTDLNQPMLDYAATRQPADNRISWRQADALTLPFEDAAFDLVCCQFGVMFFPDRQAGYREAKRVLKPGGYFLFTVSAAGSVHPAAFLWWRRRAQGRDCVAGHVRLELRNVVAKYPFERSHRFRGIKPNRGHRDYSPLSCGR